MNTIYILCFVLIVIFILSSTSSKELFYIPTETSSAYEFHTGPGYGAGYGTGYGYYGQWPKLINTEPWKNWMWGRRPDVISVPFTKMPQIDYNTPPDVLRFTTIQNKIGVNNELHKTLQLDKERIYYLNIFMPNKKLVFTTDFKNILYNTIYQNNDTIQFENNLPNTIYYMDLLNPSDHGIIFLNPVRGYSL